MYSCEECPFSDIEKTIDQYRSDMKTYRREAFTLIKNWELYNEIQNSINIFNETMPKLTAIYSLKTIDESLYSTSWLSIMKLWDGKIKGKHNVRLYRIYAFIKDYRFKEYIQKKYSEYDDIRKNHLRKRKIFLCLYYKYNYGKSKVIYDELKKIRNEFLAHAQIDSALSFQHSKDDFNKFYIDTLRIIESADYLFNNLIYFDDFQERERHNARSFIEVIAKKGASS